MTPSNDCTNEDGMWDKIESVMKWKLFVIPEVNLILIFKERQFLCLFKPDENYLTQ